ncbi:hypothetical protein T439DRAFT_359050 [Meredithblackwellia eburnea MCA 4105]
MGRLSEIRPEPGQSEAADIIRTCRTKGISALDAQLLHAEELAAPWVQYVYAVRTKGLGVLDSGLKEIILCRIAAWNSSSYEWMHHAPLAEAGGVSKEVLDYIKATPASRSLRDAPSPPSGLLTPLQAAVLAFVDHSTINVKVPIDIFNNLRKELGGVEKHVAQVAITTAAYNMVSRFLVAMDVAGAANIPVGELHH